MFMSKGEKQCWFSDDMPNEIKACDMKQSVCMESSQRYDQCFGT